MNGGEGPNESGEKEVAKPIIIVPIIRSQEFTRPPNSLTRCARHPGSGVRDLYHTPSAADPPDLLNLPSSSVHVAGPIVPEAKFTVGVGGSPRFSPTDRVGPTAPFGL